MNAGLLMWLDAFGQSPVDGWRQAYARMAADAIESVDAPLEEDEELAICDPFCLGPGDPRCRCEGNLAEPGC